MIELFFPGLVGHRFLQIHGGVAIKDRMCCCELNILYRETEKERGIRVASPKIDLLHQVNL